MAFNLSIRITAESELEAIKRAEAQVKTLAGSAKAAGDASAQGAAKASSAFDLFQQKSLGAQKVIGLAASELGRFGPAGQIASSGLFAVAGGAGVMGAAIVLASAGVAALVQYLTSAAKAKEELNAALKTGDLGFFKTEIDKTDQEIIQLTANIDKLRAKLSDPAADNKGFNQSFFAASGSQLADAEKRRDNLVAAQQGIIAERFEQATLQIEFQTAAVGKNAAEQEALAHELRVVTALQSGLKDATQEAKDKFSEASTALRDGRVGENAKRAAEAINSQVVALQFQTAAIGRTGSAFDAINLAQQRFNITQQFAGKEYDAQRGKILAQADAMFQLKRAYDQIATGRQGIADFQSAFGVQFDIEKKISGNSLADRFAATFNQFKNDPSKQAQLAAAFNSSVKQLIEMGVPDIPELLVEKIGSANFTRLSAALSEELKKPLDDSRQAGQQWGETFKKEFQDFNAGAAEVGGSIDLVKKKQEELIGLVAQPLAINIDVSAALTEIQQLQAQLAAIPDYTVKYVEVRTLASGSPVMNFSDYFNSYVPAQLAKISELSPEVAVNIPDLSKRLREVSDLEGRIERLTRDQGAQAFDPLGKFNRQSIADEIGGLASQRDDARFNLLADAARSQQQGARSSGGGGGGSGGVVNNVTIDLRGAVITQEVLDRQLLPKFEAAIKEATGKDVSYRVLN